MNTKRVAGWAAFFGVAAVLVWLPEHFQQPDDSAVAVMAAPANRKTGGTLPDASASATLAQVKDLAPRGRPVRRKQLEGHAAACQRH